jgi:hypothetical protein
MTGGVDEVVAAAHDADVSFGINHAGVSSVDPFPVKPLQVTPVESLVVFPQCPEPRRGQWDGHDNIAHLASLDFVALVVNRSHVKPGHCLASTARLYG